MRLLLAIAVAVGIVVGFLALHHVPTPPAISEADQDLAAPETAFREGSEFDPDDVQAMHHYRDQWASAFASGDADPVDFMFTRDALFALPEDAAVESAAQLFEGYTAELTFDESSEMFVTDGGNPDKMDKLPWVSYYANYSLSLTPKSGGEALESGGRFMTRFRRQSDDSLSVIRGPGIGEKAPDFALNLMSSGEEVRMSSLPIQPTVLIFGSYT